MFPNYSCNIRVIINYILKMLNVFSTPLKCHHSRTHLIFESNIILYVLLHFSSFSIYFSFISEMLYDVPISIIVLLSLFYGTISILAVVGNSLVIWIVATTRQMQTVTNFFIANLALADVTIGMFAIPFQVFSSTFV